MTAVPVSDYPTTALVPAKPVPAAPVAPRPSHALAKTIYDHASDIVAFLPEGVTLDRVVASVGLALQKVPDLAKCTPASIIFGVAKIAQWGLEIGETAYLLPYGREATPVRDYKGDIQLLIAAGACREVDAHCVYEKEHLEVTYGTNGFIEHRPIRSVKERGPLCGAYVIFRLRYGYTKHLFMPLDEIEQVRQKHSKQWKGGDMPYWYALKTVIKRGSKLLPKDARLGRVLALFDTEDDKIDPSKEVLPATVAATLSVPLDPSEPKVVLHPEFTEPAQETLFPGEVAPDDVAGQSQVLEDALCTVLPGKGSWGGYGGKTLAECRDNVLRSALMWCHEQAADPHGFAGAAGLAASVTVVLDARKAGTVVQPPKASAAA